MFSTIGDLLVTGRRQCRQLVLAALITLVAGAAHVGYTTTRYPIVLMHGMSGFDQVGAVDYFYGIPQSLRDGGARVFVAQVSAFNSSEQRGAVAATGA